MIVVSPYSWLLLVCLLATVSNMSILDALDNLKAALFGHTRYAGGGGA